MTIPHRLDLMRGPNNVQEGWKVIELPATLPSGAALKLDGELFQILAHGYEINEGELTVGLLIARTNQPIIAVGADALQGLGRGPLS